MRARALRASRACGEEVQQAWEIGQPFDLREVAHIALEDRRHVRSEPHPAALRVAAGDRLLDLVQNDRAVERCDEVLSGRNTVTKFSSFVVSLSNHERPHFDKLSANG